MKFKACFALLGAFSVGLLMNSQAMAANYTYTTPASYNNVQNESLQGRVVYVPAGSVTTVRP